MPKSKDKSPKPERNRRHSLTESNEEASPKRSTSKERKVTGSSPNKTKRKDVYSSTEKLTSSKELLEEIEEYRREAQTWLNSDAEIIRQNTPHRSITEQATQTEQDSDSSSAEVGNTRAVTKTVEAEVHQAEVNRPSALKKRIKNRTQSHESVVRFADEPREAKESPNAKALRTVLANLKLIASAKPVNQAAEERKDRARAAALLGQRRYICLPYFNNYHKYCTDYEDTSPPPPAPPDPSQRYQSEIGGAFLNNNLYDFPCEPIWPTESDFREPIHQQYTNFLPYRESAEVHEFPDLSGYFASEFGSARNSSLWNQIPLRQDEYFENPTQERFLERRPQTVCPFQPYDPIRLSRSPSPIPHQEPRLPPSDGHHSTVARPSIIEYVGPMGRMDPLGSHRSIIIEFCHMLERSKLLFNGLRELPQYGHKHWHSYFGRTFDVYTKLWKFQQQHRVILDSKYGLKRWQIGEIASKIGQLYYHFYLRTSEIAYLNEAFSFYYAIRGRSYYTQASKEDKCELMVKKLRYYARFIVTSLLLKKMKLVRELIKELDKQIIEYGNTYDPDDQNEWKIVADEVRAFIKAEPVVTVMHPDDYAVVLTHRLTPKAIPYLEKLAMMTLTLQEALVVGSNLAQVKFSELTMDMFRMLQTLEKELIIELQEIYDKSPRQRYAAITSAANNRGYNLDSSSNSPHKYLLFNPSPNQILVYLASACDDLPPNGVVLLYISAKGHIVPATKHPEEASGFDNGGLITTAKQDAAHKDTVKDDKYGNQVLHPGDLFPFTRHPMFLIIDSDNSTIFDDMPRHFGQPLVILMSPIDQPSSLHPLAGGTRAYGSLFTLFLHSPLAAFALCCDISNMSLEDWERAQTFVDAFLAEALQLLIRSRNESVQMYLPFMGDDFLRVLILRFIFCETYLRMHRSFRGRSQRTRSSPPLPDELYEHPTLTQIIMDLSTFFKARGLFTDPSGLAPPIRE